MSRRWHRRLLLAVNAAIVVDAVLILVLADLSGEAGAFGLWLLPLLALAVTLGYTPWYGVKALILGAIVLARCCSWKRTRRRSRRRRPRW